MEIGVADEQILSFQGKDFFDLETGFEKSYKRDRDKDRIKAELKCYWPWQGMTIDPMGFINLCCNSRASTPWRINLKDIESLYDVWYGPEYTKIRSEFTESGWQNHEACVTCRVGTNMGPLFHSNEIREKGIIDGLQYLELSTSNVCNQMCVTCDSQFSTLWQPYEKDFNRRSFPTYSYGKDGIDKILEVCLDVRNLHLKGGEPFADMNNLKIIKALNPEDSYINLCTNMQLVPKGFEEEIVKYPDRYNITASIDGIHDTFNWIRGGSFDNVCENMHRIYDKSGFRFNCNVTVSIYNVRKLKEIVDFFEDKPYMKEIHFELNSIVTNPWWASCMFLMHQEVYDKIISDQFDGTDISIPALKLKTQEHLMSKMEHIKYTERMNKIRGFSIDY